MKEILNSYGSLPLDAKKLRRIAYEIVAEDENVPRLSDKQVLRSLIGKKFPNDPANQDLVSLALLVARNYECDLNPSVDVVVANNGKIELSESYWRKVVASITGQPWVFILNYADNKASSIHEDVHGFSYGFHEDVTTWNGIVAAGPGSIVVFYNTSNAPSSPMCFSGVAKVRQIEELKTASDGKRAWRTYLEDFHEINPVKGDSVNILRRNVQHGIQAISWNSYNEIIKLAKFEYSPDHHVVDASITDEFENPRGSDIRIEAFKGPDLVVPNFAAIELDKIPLQNYAPNSEDTTGNSYSKTSKRNRNLDKLTEVRAVEIATMYMSSIGWTLKHDRQRDGVGYDLEFEKDGVTLLVEVKGIRGSTLAFNMTAKEWYQCISGSKFLLIAITRVLENENFLINPLWPNEICKLRRHATQFRLSPSK
jgi:hypothetical protein